MVKRQYKPLQPYPSPTHRYSRYYGVVHVVNHHKPTLLPHFPTQKPTIKNYKTTQKPTNRGLRVDYEVSSQYR